MADEVDALMAIRGSLETTDGIDLVEEIAELGRLYSQASAPRPYPGGAAGAPLRGNFSHWQY